jgi:hypothetical protein
MKNDIFILTGSLGGDKTTLINELCREIYGKNRFLMLHKAISINRKTGVNLSVKLFQRLLVEMERGLEYSVLRILLPDDNYIPKLLCYIGMFYPLAYWLQYGWSTKKIIYFTYTTRNEHHRYYTAVLYLITAAYGANSHYIRGQNVHHLENPKIAIRINKLLEQTWNNNPHFNIINNANKDWSAKPEKVRRICYQYV